MRPKALLQRKARPVDHSPGHKPDNCRPSCWRPLPVVLVAVRIVLVQNIGLAVIAGLIGGGGFGTFVFQGIGQTAMDLVLLGALPTVLLAFAAAVILDAAIEITGKGSSQ